MNKIEIYVNEIIKIAKDDKHGYSQKNRNGTPDYDCSSLVISCVDKSGIPVKSHGASYTGNIYNAFIKSGFIDVTKTINLVNGNGLVKGDILLTPYKHTEIYTGKGNITGARKDYDNKTGDSSGKEIETHKYKNYPWKYVLRYNENNNFVNMSSDRNNNNNIDVLVTDIILGKYGNGTKRKKAIEEMGYDYKEIQKLVNAKLKK